MFHVKTWKTFVTLNRPTSRRRPRTNFSVCPFIYDLKFRRLSHQSFKVKARFVRYSNKHKIESLENEQNIPW